VSAGHGGEHDGRGHDGEDDGHEHATAEELAPAGEHDGCELGGEELAPAGLDGDDGEELATA
jgi:hypothetical protein